MTLYEPLISVIVTTYNRPVYLGNCLRSILKQSYVNFEIIVVSDGRNDENKVMIDSLQDSRLFYYELEHSGLPAISRNYGITKSNGTYIAFCDDDDTWHDQKLAIQEQFIRSNNCHFLFCDAYRIDAGGSLIVPFHPVLNSFIINTEKLLFRSKWYIYGKNYITLSSVVVHRELIDQINYCVNPNFRGSEDYHFILKINYNYKLCYLDEKLVYYRVHEKNLSKSRKEGYQRSIEILSMLKNDNNISLGCQIIGKLIYYFKLSVVILIEKLSFK